MNKNYKIGFDMIRTISQASYIKLKRSFADFLTDRIVQASTEPTLLAFVERLANSVNIEIDELYSPTVKSFIANINSLTPILAWVRKYPTATAMIVTLKTEDYLEAIGGLEIEEIDVQEGIANRMPDSDVQIRLTCLSPFAHGSDAKAGNATIFRRQDIICTNGAMLSLPFYAGNAFRGTMRDALADHLISSLGLAPRRDKPPVELWFFHALYAGGALEEAGAALKPVMEKIGKNGAINSGGIKELRDLLPGLSLLGTAIGNRILAGRVDFNDFRPQCVEYGSGGIQAAELFEWTYITRREDHEEHIDHHGMIANTECLKAGTVMDGGIDMSLHISDLERSALGMGLRLLKDRGSLGAENRRGLGKVEMEITNAPDPAMYQSFLQENKEEIMKYLEAINAINPSS